MRRRWLLVLAAVAAAAAALAIGIGRRGPIGDLQYFPGATVVGSTSSEGELFGFPAASWQQVELRTTVPYERVRDFYAAVTAGAASTTFESEVKKSGGRVYLRFLADRRRARFYAIMVEERQFSGDVSILLRSGTGLARDAGPRPTVGR
jgi:hypothetical protein